MFSHPYEEVNHEEDIKSQVYLLGCVLYPGDALLHAITNV